MIVFIYHTILNCKESLCILGCHSEECSKHHPEQGTRATGSDCCCDTDDISGSDCR